MNKLTEVFTYIKHFPAFNRHPYLLKLEVRNEIHIFSNWRYSQVATAKVSYFCPQKPQNKYTYEILICMK